MSIADEYEELAVKMANSPDIYPIANMLRDRDAAMYNKGYQACANDRRLSKLAAEKARQRSFAEELDIIDDVIATPYDVSTT